MIMVLLVGHSEVICPLPKHLKHFMFLVLLPPTLGAIDFPCGDVGVGLDELPPSFLDLLAQFWF